MEIKKTGLAGTVESSDILITLEPGGDGIAIHLDSAVEKQFGGQIRAVISETLQELGIRQATVTAVDRGALDCVIRARVKTAAYRASGEEGYRWEVKSR